MNRLSALDALFLYGEDGISHMHIGSCALFAGPAPSRRALAAHVARKLHLVPRFRQRVQPRARSARQYYALHRPQSFLSRPFSF